MACAGNNHQFLVITFQSLERIFTEIVRVRLLAMNDQHGIFDFVRTAHQWEIDERDGFRRVASLIGVERAGVIAARGLVVGVVVLEELRGIGRQGVGNAAARLRKSVAEILRALCREFLRSALRASALSSASK